MQWIDKAFDELTVNELFEIYKLRPQFLIPNKTVAIVILTIKTFKRDTFSVSKISTSLPMPVILLKRIPFLLGGW